MSLGPVLPVSADVKAENDSYLQRFLRRCGRGIDRRALALRFHEAIGSLSTDHWRPFLGLLDSLPCAGKLPDGERVSCDYSGGEIRIGEASQLPADLHESLREAIAMLVPWRKGPFSLFGIPIDAEWRSDFKWDRIADSPDSLKGKRVADIAASNGYYMFRMSALEPQALIGFDPCQRSYHSFRLFQHFAREDNLLYCPFGVEYLDLFQDFFDVVFCMGLLYHRRSPIDDLKRINSSMSRGGQLIVESMAIPAQGSMALFPEGRYAKMRNVYFIPTATCLVSWHKRASFVDVEIFSFEKLGPQEQRKTKLAPFESLSDYLDPANPDLTVEGYPAPQRVCARARKR